MIFTTLVSSLKKAVELAERISGKNLTLPMLNNVLITTDKNKVFISATDLEIGIKLSVSGKLEKEGKVALSAKTFSSFLASLPEEKITLKKENDSLKAIAGTYEVKFPLVNVEDFPIIPTVSSNNYIEINKQLFRKAISQVIPSVSYNTTKPEISGVFLKYDGKDAELVGTDSFRLARKVITKENIKSNIKKEVNLIIPLRTMQELERVLQEEFEETSSELIKISFDNNQIQFSLDNIQLVSRLISGEFPKYSSVIPLEFTNKVIVSRNEIIEAIKVVGLFSGRINDTKFQLYPSKKEIIIEAQDPSLGKSHANITAEKMEGEDLEIGFNYRFLLDGINSSQGNKIFIGLNKNDSPILIRGEEEGDFMYILMPTRL